MRQLNNIPNILERNIDQKVNSEEKNFLINDIYLYVPPTSISFHKENLEYSYKSLRSRVSTKILSGNGSFHAQVNITIPPEGIVQLHRLICQVRNSPFVYIENKFIQDSMLIVSERRGLLFTLFGINVQNHPSSPTSWLVELDLRYFNHKPYIENINFKRHVEDGFKKGVFYKNDVFDAFIKNAKVANESSRFLARKSSSNKVNIQTYLTNKEFFNNSYYELVKTKNPTQSDAYVTYSNFLQIKSLYENFNIEFKRKDGQRAEDNVIALSDEQIAALCGLSTYKQNNKTYVVNSIGLHEKGFGFFEETDAKKKSSYISMIPVRNQLINLMLSTGLNTKAVVKNFVKIDLSADFLNRYNKALLVGTSGLNNKAKKEKMESNKRQIADFFTGRQIKEIPAPTQKPEKSDKNEFCEVITPFKKTKIVIKEIDGTKYCKLKDAFGESEFILSYIDIEDNVKIKKSYSKGELLPVKVVKQTDEENQAVWFYRADSSYVVLNVYKKEEDKKIQYIAESSDYAENNRVLNPIVNNKLAMYPLWRNADVDNAPKNIQIIINNELKDDLKEDGDDSSWESYYFSELQTDKIEEKHIQKHKKFKSKLDLNDKKEYDKIQEKISELGGVPYVHRNDVPNIIEYLLEIPLHNNYLEEDIVLATGHSVKGSFKDDLFDINFRGIITNVSCSLRHICTSLPIIGQEYPTHQYLGSIEPLYQFNFVGDGIDGGIPNKLKSLESIRASTSYMAKNFPEIPDASNFYIISFLTMLMGSTNKRSDIEFIENTDDIRSSRYILKPRFIVNSMDTQTVEGNPGAVSLNFRFSESKPYLEEEMKPSYTNDVSVKEIESYIKERQAQGISKGTKEENKKKREVILQEDWETFYFTRDEWYSKSYRTIRKKALKPIDNNELLSKTQDQIGEFFVLQYLDKFQEYLFKYKDAFRTDNKDLAIKLISTFDHQSSGKRETNSNHYFNSGADIYVTNMGVIELSFLLVKFFRNHKIGVGIYGSNEVIRGDEFYNLVRDDDNVDLINQTKLKEFFQDSENHCDGSGSKGFVHLDWGINVKKTLESSDELNRLGELKEWFENSYDGSDHRLVMHYGKRFWADYNSNDANDFLRWTLFDGTVLNNRPQSGNPTKYKGVAGSSIFNDSEVNRLFENLNIAFTAPDYSSPDVMLENVESNVEEVEEPEDASSLEEEDLQVFANNFRKSHKQVFNFTSDREIKEALRERGLSEAILKRIKIKRSKRTLKDGRKAEEIQLISLTNSNDDIETIKSVFKGIKRELKKYEFIPKNDSSNNAVTAVYTPKTRNTASASQKLIIKTEYFTKDYYKDAEFDSELNASEKLLEAFPAFASALLTEPALYTYDIDSEVARIKKELYGFDIVPNFYRSIFGGLGVNLKSDKSNKNSKNSLVFENFKLISAENAGIAAASGLLALGPLGWVSLVGGGVSMIISAYNGMASGGRFQYKRIHDGVNKDESSFIQKVNIADSNINMFGNKTKEEIKAIVESLKNKGKFEATKSALVNFYERVSDEDTLGGAYIDFVKNIYSKLRAFTLFNEHASSLSSTSAARALIKKSTQEIIYDDVNNLDDQKKYEMLVLSKEITGQEILDFLDYLFVFPKSKPDFLNFVEEDIEELFEEVNGGENYQAIEIGSFRNRRRPAIGTDLQFRDKNRELSLLQNQINDTSFHFYIMPYFSKNEEKLKKQQDIKLAFLKNLLEAIIKENIALNKAGKGVNRSIAEKYGLDAENFFDLTNNYTYPDNDLSHFDNGIYSKRFHPAFYFYDYNSFNKKLNERVKKEDSNQKRILDASIKFGENLRNFVYSGPSEGIKNRDLVKNESLIDKNNLLSDSSDFFIHTGNTYKIKVGKGNILTRNKTQKKVAQVAEISFISNTKDIIADNTLLNVNIDKELVGSNSGEDTKTIVKKLKENIEEQKNTYKSIKDSFGSEYGRKLSDEKKENIKTALATNGTKINENILVNLGLNNERVFDKETVLNLTEDAYQSMLKKKSMKNAFPTFALYLIEEDEVVAEKYYAFDDFFYYNSVISFAFHNSRESSSTVANIQLQNISGILDGSRKDYLRDIDISGKVDEDKLFREGNYIDSIVLRPGITVQLRAGYEADANELDVLLTGLITDINYGQNSSLCNITVQSFGVELEAIRKGNDPNSYEDVEFNSTHQLLGSLMMSEELRHFGRHRKGVFFQTGEYRDLAVQLEIPQKEALFKFNYSRGWIDFFTDNSFSTMFTVGVVSTIAFPLLGKLGAVEGVSKFVRFDNIAKAFQSSKLLRPVLGFGGRLLNPARVWSMKGGSAVTKAYSRASTKYLTTLNGRGGAVVYNQADDLLDDLIRGTGLNSSVFKTGQIDELGQASLERIFLEELGSTMYARGGFLTSIFRRVSKDSALNAQRGQDVLRSLMKRRGGITALSVEGFVGTGKFAYSYEVAGLLGNVLLGSISIRNRFGGFAGASVIGLLLAGVDVAIDLVSNTIEFLYSAFTLKEDRRRLKQTYIINPKDDNIYCPNPETYMKNIPGRNDFNLGIESFIDQYAENFFRFTNDTFFGLFNLVKNVWQGENINIFSLINKQLDVSKGENKFFLTGQTIWQVLHELTLRHPGWIYGVRPYEDSLEYRVFFGVPNQRYFKRRLNANTVRKLDSIARLLNSKDAIERISTVQLEKIGIRFANKMLKEEKLDQLYSYWLKKTKDRFVPYRQFHYVSSKENLMANNLIVSGHNVINAVSANYIDIDDSGDNNPGVKHLEQNTKKIYKAKANSLIPMERIKEKTINYRNCINLTNAVRYSMGELLYGMRNMYEGSLLILGDTKINPWDVCILEDSVNNMFGPVEVKSISHNFSYQTGFITEVECSAIVTGNEELTQTVLDQAIIYETRRRIFNEYNSKEELLAGRDGEESEKYKEVIEKEVQEIIMKMIEDNQEWQGFVKEALGPGTSVQIANKNKQYFKQLFENAFNRSNKERTESQKQVDTYVDNLVDRIYNLNTQNGAINFLSELNLKRPGLPSEANNLVKYPLVGLSAASGASGLGALFVSRAFKNKGLSLVKNAGITSFLFFGATSALALNSDSITTGILDSATSGMIGKNLWREKILSRMETNQLIKVFPLYKDGIPLLAGGMEFVDPSERWNNILGNIYNGYSDGIKGYIDRKSSLQETGRKAFELYKDNEFNSWTSAIVLNSGVEYLLGKNATYLELVGYLYSE